MRKKILLSCMLLLFLACLGGTAAADPVISFDPASITLAPGGTTQVTIRLSEAPNGLAGYQFNIVFPPSVAKVTSASFPSWAILNRNTAGTTTFKLSAVDLNKQVQSGLSNIELATITVMSTGIGTATFTISDLQADSDTAAPLTPLTGNLQVTVTGSGTTTTTTTTTASATATTTGTATATTSVMTAPTTIAATTATTAPVVTATAGLLPGAPVAGFTAMPASGAAPLKVQFYDRSTNAPTTYEWDFGDGGSSMAQNPSYTYSSEGLYTVKLKVLNEKGTTTATFKNYIAVGEKYIAMQPTPVLTQSTRSDLPAPASIRTTAGTAAATTGYTVKPTGKAAAEIATPLASLLVLVTLWALVSRK